MDLGLEGEKCFVTGSTDGIGLETVRLLVAEGARVVTSGRRGPPGIGEVAHVEADLSLGGEPERAVIEATRELTGLDVLVNNVGVARQARFEDVPDEEWDEYWQLNVMSYVRAIRAALPSLREGGGAIVNVSSTAGKRPSTGMPHYSVTKAAVLSLSRLVADLYAGDAERVWRAWRGALHTIGREVEFCDSEGTVRGRAVDVQRDGGLVIEVPDEGLRRTIYAGDAIEPP